jgi:predicted transcriptional regulator
MSGMLVAESDRDFVSYIPPINRSVVQELDRSLRDTLAVFGQTQASVDPKPNDLLRDITGSVDAVERAASLIGSMAGRIQTLEKRLEEESAQLLAMSVQRDQVSAQCALVGEKLAAETERRLLVETLNKEHVSYAEGLTRDLSAAHANIERLTAVIAEAFGSIETRP